jgi:hypothetical protein
MYVPEYRDKSSCWLSAPNARRRSGTATIREAATLERVSRVLQALQARHVDAEVPDPVEPADVHLAQTPVRLWATRSPGCRTVVRPQVEIRVIRPVERVML